MKNRLLGFVVRQAHHPEQSRRAALGFLLIAFVLAFAPVVRAQGVDDKIQALENELGRLKSEQMELKKEAVAAAAALPTFAYRPRSGVTIAAADRSWSIQTFLLGQWHMYNNLDSQPHTDVDRTGGEDFRSRGDIFTRRFRPGWTLCVMNCLYEWHQTWDVDTGDTAANQNAGLYMRFSKINPWLPDIFVGDEDSITSYNQVSRSSSSSAQLELAQDLLSDSAVSNLSRRNIGFGWLNKPLGQGSVNFALEYRVGAGITEDDHTDSDRKEFAAILGVRPFTRSKNPWLQRLRGGIATTISSVDSRSGELGDRLRIRTDERMGRLTLLDANNVGDGLHHNIQGGVEWGYGPYLTRVEGGYSKYESGQIGTASSAVSHVRGGFWRIGHELFLFSPKGFLTGGAYQPGTVQIGWGFQRTQAFCGKGKECDPDEGDFNNIRLLKRELDLWYHWNAFSRIGFIWNWWDADNVPRDFQRVVGCAKNSGTAGGTVGKGCDWHSVNLALQVYF